MGEGSEWIFPNSDQTGRLDRQLILGLELGQYMRLGNLPYQSERRGKETVRGSGESEKTIKEHKGHKVSVTGAIFKLPI